MRNYFIGICILLTGLVSSAQSPLPCISDCASSSAIDNCALSGMSKISDFRNGALFYSPSSCPDGLCPGSVWRFPAINTLGGLVINATATIDAINNAKLQKIDDDAATDLNGNAKTSLLSPSITPDVSLNGVDRKGYVQFTVRFFSAEVGDGYSLLINLANLSVYQYDVDGDNAGNVNIGNSGSWYRETSSIKFREAANPSTEFDQSTELISTDLTDGNDRWVGSISSLCGKNGLSQCPQNLAASRFSKPQYSITMRLGYDYNAGGNIGQPVSQYGIKFGCFSTPSGIQLPVNLYDFTARRNNNTVKLQWTTTYEQMNQGFRVMRKTIGDFQEITFMPSLAAGGNSQINLTYTYNDVNNFKGVSQYRIIQTDIEGKIRVSETRSVAGESSKSDIIVYPNPSSNDGAVTIVFENSRTLRDAVLSNMLGQQVKKWTKISANTIVLENLQAGVYHFSVIDNETGERQNTRFVVN
jgi:hypothetical protein